MVLTRSRRHHARKQATTSKSTDAAPVPTPATILKTGTKTGSKDKPRESSTVRKRPVSKPKVAFKDPGLENTATGGMGQVPGAASDQRQGRLQEGFPVEIYLNYLHDQTVTANEGSRMLLNGIFDKFRSNPNKEYPILWVSECFNRIYLASQLQLTMCKCLARHQASGWFVETGQSERLGQLVSVVDLLMGQAAVPGNGLDAPTFYHLLQTIGVEDPNIKSRQGDIGESATPRRTQKHHKEREDIAGFSTIPNVGSNRRPNLDKTWDGIFKSSNPQGSGLDKGGSMLDTVKRLLSSTGALSSTDGNGLSDGNQNQAGEKDSRLDIVLGGLDPISNILISAAVDEFNEESQNPIVKKRKRQESGTGTSATESAREESVENIIAMAEALEDENHKPSKRRKQKVLSRHEAIARADAKIEEKLQNLQRMLIEESRGKVANPTQPTQPPSAAK